MREFETKIQELKFNVLKEVTSLAFDGNLGTGVLDIPEKIIPGRNPISAAASIRNGPSSATGSSWRWAVICPIPAW